MNSIVDISAHASQVQILTILENDIKELESTLELLINNGSNLLDQIIILKLSDKLTLTIPDMAMLLDTLQEMGIIVAGIISSDKKIREFAHYSGLKAVQHLSSLTAQPEKEQKAEAAKQFSHADDTKSTQRERTPRTIIVRQPIKAGQRVRNQYGDLVVLGTVEKGAVVAAKGDVIIHAPCEGVVLAGINGNTDATIYTNQLLAEAISIGNYFAKSTKFSGVRKDLPLKISLNGSQLNFTGLNKPFPSPESQISKQPEKQNLSTPESPSSATASPPPSTPINPSRKEPLISPITENQIS